MARQKRHFTASHKSLSAEGVTKAEASAKLEAQIDWALESRPMHVEKRWGWLIIISATALGYESSLLDVSALEHGKQRSATELHGQVDFNGVLQSKRLHAAQNAWTLDRDTWVFVEQSGLDPHHANELRSWIAWQRRYAEARKNGATDGEAHHQACMAA